MMKKLLLLSTLCASFLTYSQTNCSTAVDLVANTTITNVVYGSGAVQTSCFTNTTADASQTAAPLAGAWYKFTRPASGNVTVSSVLPANVAPKSIDTRVSVFSLAGDCATGTFSCVAAIDDVSATEYRSTLTFQVAANTTYYVYWDNNWSNASFDFSFAYTQVDCLPSLNTLNTTAITATSATLNWQPSLSAPTLGYEIEYGISGFVIGTGTIATTAVGITTLALTGLTNGANYDYYVKSKCSAILTSANSTKNSFPLLKSMPFSNSFDTDNSIVGWTVAGNGAYGLGAVAANAQGGVGRYWIMNNNTAAATNNWIFSPAVTLTAGEQVTVKYWIRCGTARNFKCTVGTSNTIATQTTNLLTESGITHTTYTQKTATYTAPSTGNYYFGFNDFSPIAAAVATLRLDTIEMTSAPLSTQPFDIVNKIRMYPNPAKDILNIDNAGTEITNVTITDVNGRIIKEISKNTSAISVSDLSKGIYIVSINTENGKKVEKLIIE